MVVAACADAVAVAAAAAVVAAVLNVVHTSAADSNWILLANKSRVVDRH